MTDSRIFIDTSPFIYALEDNERYSEPVRKAFNSYHLSAIPLCTSLLTFTEYCVVPYRKNEPRKIADFEAFLFDADIAVLPLTKQIAKYASWIRAKYQGIKAMDALQLSSAIQYQCGVFLTNDKQLKQVEEIRVLLADEL